MNELFKKFIAYERDLAIAEETEKIREEGLLKGREEAREEDRRAREQEMKKSAHKMLERGLASYEIAEILDVPQATVDAWLAE